MPAVLAMRAIKGCYPLEVLHFLEEADGSINTVEVTVSIQENTSGQRRKWRVCGRDVRKLATEVVGYIEECAGLCDSVDVIVVAKSVPEITKSRCKSAPEAALNP